MLLLFSENWIDKQMFEKQKQSTFFVKKTGGRFPPVFETSFYNP